MFEILVIPIIVIIIAIWNLIKPMQSDGPIVIKFARRNPELWNLSQRLYAVKALMLNVTFCIIAIILGQNSFLESGFIRFIIIMSIQLFPMVTTYIVLRFIHHRRR
jgi:hypothetical protein